jgi:cysteine-S-conjugate beta-lyase
MGTGAFDVDASAMARRTGTKWSRFGPEVLPAWIAEMDFAVAPVIREALAAQVASSDLGYPPDSNRTGLPERFAARAADRWGWDVDPGRVHLVPNVMTAIHHAIEAFTAPGEGVIVTTPVYPPFLSVVPHAGRQPVWVPLVDGRLDLDGVADALAAGARLLLLCHPHNPTGHVLDEAELATLAHLVAEHEAWVVSDEIHAELTLAPARHRPFATLGPDVAARTVTVTGASKAFNLAGLRCAVTVTGTDEAHTRFGHVAEPTLDTVGALGITATLAAWTPEGDTWLAACLEHLVAQRDHLAHRLADDLPILRWRPPEATYLAWLDCRGLGFAGEPAEQLLAEARVALTPGRDFGPPGAGFARLNFATSRALLDELLDRLRRAHPPIAVSRARRV